MTNDELRERIQLLRDMGVTYAEVDGMKLVIGVARPEEPPAPRPALTLEQRLFGKLPKFERAPDAPPPRPPARPAVREDGSS